MKTIKEKIRDGKAIVKVGSHRAREKLYNLIGREPQGYHKWWKDGEWREVTPEELVKIKERPIKGITESHWTKEHSPYWTEMAESVHNGTKFAQNNSL